MKEFESVFIAKPNLTKKELNEVTKNVENKIKELADITYKEEMGLRKLAYEIKKFHEGFYVAHQFKVKDDIGKRDVQKDIERYLKTQEEIIRYIVIERD